MLTLFVAQKWPVWDPFFDPKSHEKVYVGPLLRSFPGNEAHRLFSGAPKGGFWAGAESLCRRNLCACMSCPFYGRGATQPFHLTFGNARREDTLSWPLGPAAGALGRRSLHRGPSGESHRSPPSCAPSSPAIIRDRILVHDCGYPLSRYTCRATRVAADFLDFIAFCRCSSGAAPHPLKIVVSLLPPPIPGRCRTEIWV